jgi:hypothetical protein
MYGILTVAEYKYNLHFAYLSIYLFILLSTMPVVESRVIEQLVSNAVRNKKERSVPGVIERSFPAFASKN